MSEDNIIDGKAFAAGLRERVAAKVAALEAQKGVTPGLAVVLVGQDHEDVRPVGGFEADHKID